MYYYRVNGDCSVAYYGDVKKGDFLYIPVGAVFVYETSLIEFVSSNDYDNFDFKPLLDKIWYYGNDRGVLEEKAKNLIFDLLYLYDIIVKYATNKISFYEAQSFLGSKNIPDIKEACEDYIARKIQYEKDKNNRAFSYKSVMEANTFVMNPVKYIANTNDVEKIDLTYSNRTYVSSKSEIDVQVSDFKTNTCKGCGYKFEVSEMIIGKYVKIKEDFFCEKCYEVLLGEVRLKNKLDGGKEDKKAERFLDF